MDGEVLIVGGGPAGLAVAAELQRRAVGAKVLDRAARVGDSWRAHYDHLHLHTTRRGSRLPGLAIPRAYGRWVSRDDFVAYQEAYARHHRLDVRHGTTVRRIDRAPGGFQLDTTAGDLHARAVVVATGFNHTPILPDWATSGRFGGEVIHARAYRNPKPYAGKRVLVVGPGNTGSEIAQDLAEQAVDVTLSVRTPPLVLRRAIGGIPSQALGILLRPLPARVLDPVAARMSRLAVGDLTRHGMPRPSPRGYSHFLESGVTPILDVGFVRMLKAGRIRIAAAVTDVEPGAARTADGGRVEADVIVCATGYRRGLEPLVGHLGVLDARGLPGDGMEGLHFLGYRYPLSGLLREIRLQAPRIARAIAAEGRR